jgi:RimJ/RimL family protein N-acetyltransferase
LYQPLSTLQTIETPRLILRPVQHGDEVPLNHTIRRSLHVLRPWMPWAQDLRIEATRTFVEKGIAARRARPLTDFPMVVIHKADQQIIGASGYNNCSLFDDGIYDIGYWCDVAYHGHGYVTEYVNALTRYALDSGQAKPHPHTVVIRTNVLNAKSIAVAKRLNFRFQGTQPSVTQEGETDACFVRDSTVGLPPLEVSWQHTKPKDTPA